MDSMLSPPEYIHRLRTQEGNGEAQHRRPDRDDGNIQSLNGAGGVAEEKVVRLRHVVSDLEKRNDALRRQIELLKSPKANTPERRARQGSQDHVREEGAVRKRRRLMDGGEQSLDGDIDTLENCDEPMAPPEGDNISHCYSIILTD